MINEIDGRLPASEILQSVVELKSDDRVLAIRGGAVERTREQWIKALSSLSEIVADRRHYAPKWAAEDAVKMQQVQQAAPAGHPGQESSAEEQMAPADWWEISYQPDKDAAYAYAKVAQPLHTDNAWFADPAELNFFIMQKQAATGGEQKFYLLERLVDDMTSDEPGLLNDLCNVEVTIKKGDNDYYNQTTIIRLDDDPKIFWNFYRTEKPTDEIKAMCDAFFAYLQRKETSPSVTLLRCESGDCMAFNDLKMLHGRTEYEAEKPFDRVLLHSMWKFT